MKIRMIFCLNFLIFCVLNGVCQDNSNLESYLANAGDSGTFNQSKISGSLLNFIPGLNKDLVVKYVVTIPGLQNQVIKKIELKEDGSFEIIIEKAMPYQLVWLTIGDYYSGKVILNSSLEIKADLKVLEKSPVELIGKGITFSGEDGGLTTYVNEYAKFNVPKKIKLNKEKFNILMNRTAQPVYKEKLLSEHYDLLAKIEKDFSRKKGKEYAWFLENERLTEMHTDYMSIYLGREIEEKIWNQALEHSPKTMTSYTNQFYDVMAYFVSNPTENQMRKLRKKIYITDATNAEEVDKLNNFLKEMDKRSAGLSYDNEIYANGLEEYVKKYENLLEKAKLENMTSILQSLPVNKRGLNLLKLLPQKVEERKKFVKDIESLILGQWYEPMIVNELEEEIIRRQEISDLFSNIKNKDLTSRLGRDGTHLASGAGVFISNAKNARTLLRNIRSTFGPRALVIIIWTPESTTSIDEMKRSLAMIDRLQALSVDVVFLCTDEGTDPETWKKTITQLYIGGEHIFLGQVLSIDLLELLNLNTYPIHLFVDRFGNYDPDFIDELPNINIPELSKRLR